MAQAYVAFQLSSPELLASVFFWKNDETRPQIEAALVKEAKKHWLVQRDCYASSKSRKKGDGVMSGVFPFVESGVGGSSCCVWLAQGSVVCHAMVLSSSATSVQMALATLTTYHALLSEHATKSSSCVETFLLKPEEALLLLEKLAPQGQLLVLTPALIRHIQNRHVQSFK